MLSKSHVRTYYMYDLYYTLTWELTVKYDYNSYEVAVSCCISGLHRLSDCHQTARFFLWGGWWEVWNKLNSELVTLEVIYHRRLGNMYHAYIMLFKPETCIKNMIFVKAYWFLTCCHVLFAWYRATTLVLYSKAECLWNISAISIHHSLYM